MTMGRTQDCRFFIAISRRLVAQIEAFYFIWDDNSDDDEDVDSTPSATATVTAAAACSRI